MTRCNAIIAIFSANQSEEISILASNQNSPPSKCSRWASLAGVICATASMNFRRIGLKALNYFLSVGPGMIKALISLASMRLYHWKYGDKKAGFILTILEAGFNGIAAITWAEESKKKTKGKSNAG